jgi:hypothetical protein
MKLKTGKNEITYLLKLVFEKYETETGKELIRNTNRKNYEEVAKLLSKISNQLPYTEDQFQHDYYSEDRNSKKLEYPYLKYDITGGQLKDAYNGFVSKPRSYLLDACYIYLFGVGRIGFEKDIKDEHLICDESYKEEKITANTSHKKWYILIGFLIVIILISSFKWWETSKKMMTIRKDLMIAPYQPTAAEIDSLEGIWLVYIGSPQARTSDTNRYHKVVRNILDIKYKDGYFLFNRYGAGFDHYGYMQFENPEVISIHSYVNNNSNVVESPRLSLMRLEKGEKKINVISASWNFDEKEKNDIIGIREVYIKQAGVGNVKEVINTVENNSCHCKILVWTKNNDTKTYYLRNELIEDLKDTTLKSMIDEQSILLRKPKKGVVLSEQN